MLDKAYLPMYSFYKEFCKGVFEEGGKPFFLALQRSDGGIKTFKTRIFISESERRRNLRLAERLVKFMLWGYGGFRFYIYGDSGICKELAEIYSSEGDRAFDAAFMAGVYRRPLEFVCVTDINKFPSETEHIVYPSPDAKGYRIGFDAGGSDRKVTACIDGAVVYENETVWNPKLNSDPAYHEAGIRDSIDRALAALSGRVDGIGVSTAGIVIDNEVRVASLFRLVPEELFESRIAPIYKNLSDIYGCPVTVANDGDVAALAGAYQIGDGMLLGTAMGTSLAAGYINKDMGIAGYLNELAFVPVDANPEACCDEWSGDRGVGSLYHSQDGVIRLAADAGINLDGCSTPAEKLKVVQRLAEEGAAAACQVFERMGDYYGYSILWFAEFYPIRNVVFLGRVASGRGGEILLAKAKGIISSEGSDIKIIMPDENSRRLGQSYTAASM